MDCQEEFEFFDGAFLEAKPEVNWGAVFDSYQDNTENILLTPDGDDNCIQQSILEEASSPRNSTPECTDTFCDTKTSVTDFRKKHPNFSRDLYLNLIQMPVKDFNVSIKKNNLSKEEIADLKTDRKRNKNRDAAIRSRAKKEKYVQTLEREVTHLKIENQRNGDLIKQLKERIEKLESSRK